MGRMGGLICQLGLSLMQFVNSQALFVHLRWIFVKVEHFSGILNLLWHVCRRNTFWSLVGQTSSKCRMRRCKDMLLHLSVQGVLFSFACWSLCVQFTPVSREGRTFDDNRFLIRILAAMLVHYCAALFKSYRIWRKHLGWLRIREIANYFSILRRTVNGGHHVCVCRFCSLFGL